MNVDKHLEGTTPSIEIEDGAFYIEITNNEIEILCEWDYGYGGRGNERCTLALDVLEQLIAEYRAVVPKTV